MTTCRSCGQDSDVSYRCSHCGADLVGRDEDDRRLMTDGGGLPEHVQKAKEDGHIQHSTRQMAVLEYEERFLDVEFGDLKCRVCESEAHHRIETDSYRDRVAITCGDCGLTDVSEDENSSRTQGVEA